MEVTQLETGTLCEFCCTPLNKCHQLSYFDEMTPPSADDVIYVQSLIWKSVIDIFMFAVLSVKSAVVSVQRSVCHVQCVFISVQCAVFNVQCSVFIVR